MFAISSLRYLDTVLKTRFLMCSVDIFFETTFALNSLEQQENDCHKIEDKFLKRRFPPEVLHAYHVKIQQTWEELLIQNAG